MRQLKQQSGLTYRQLENRAAARGDVLARSTMADVLGGKRAPRQEFLTAFVRACGNDDQLDVWLRTWREIAAHQQKAEPVAAGRPGWHRRLIFVLAGVLVVVLAAAAVVAWSGLTRNEAPASSSARAPTLPSGWIRIRPITAPRLCLTDGRVRDGRFTPLVAVQRPCDAVAPQTTMLQLVSGDAYRIQWHHPDCGMGCLKALAEGPGSGLLEPWDACEQSSLFHIEPSGAYDSGFYVLRVEGQGCVGIAGSDTAEGTEAVMQRCIGKGRQIFVIEPAT